MNENILKTMGQIAGIGGLALGVFLILLWKIVGSYREDLTRDHRYKLFKMVLILISIITIVGMGGWIYIEARKTALPAVIKAEGLPPGNEPTNTDKVSPKKTTQEINLSAEFILDGNQTPLTVPSTEKGLKNYRIKLSLENAPPDLTEVIYDPNDSSFKDEVYPSYHKPEFKIDDGFDSFGELDIKVTLKNGDSEKVIHKSLKEALGHKYGEDTNPQIREALRQIENN